MKKPIAVVITDTHMSDKNIPLVKDIFKQTFEYCRENKIKQIFHGGDWFTSRTGQSIDCLIATHEIIRELEKKGENLVMNIIAGNHDKNDQSRKQSFLTIFSSPFFVVNSDPVTIENDENGFSFSMIPYFTEEIYSSNLNSLTDFVVGRNRSIKHHILITHVAVNGVKNNDGSEVTTGQSPKAFSKWDKVLIGHYHNKSTIGKNIHYIGSAYQANFGEDSDKGITVIYDDGSIEQVKLKFPEFVKFTADAKGISAADIKDLQKIKEEHPDRNIRIVLTGSEQEVNSFNKGLLESIGISVDKKPNDIDAFTPDEEIIPVSYNKENLGLAFEEFCDFKGIEDRDYGRTTIGKL